jgi:hypothetical protein
MRYWCDQMLFAGLPSGVGRASRSSFVPSSASSLKRSDHQAPVLLSLQLPGNSKEPAKPGWRKQRYAQELVLALGNTKTEILYKPPPPRSRCMPLFHSYPLLPHTVRCFALDPSVLPLPLPLPCSLGLKRTAAASTVVPPSPPWPMRVVAQTDRDIQGCICLACQTISVVLKLRLHHINCRLLSYTLLCTCFLLTHPQTKTRYIAPPIKRSSAFRWHFHVPLQEEASLWLSWE